MILGILTTTDIIGNTFEKQVTMGLEGNAITISFGSPYTWYYNDVIRPPISGDTMWLDIDGHNHKGYPVKYSYKELMELIAPTKETDA